MVLASQGHSFHNYPELEAKRLLKELLDRPECYNTILEQYVARVTCRLVWGDASLAADIGTISADLLYAISPAGSIANKFPILLSLSDWMSPVKRWEKARSAR